MPQWPFECREDRNRHWYRYVVDSPGCPIESASDSSTSICPAVLAIVVATAVRIQRKRRFEANAKLIAMQQSNMPPQGQPYYSNPYSAGQWNDGPGGTGYQSTVHNANYPPPPQPSYQPGVYTPPVRTVTSLRQALKVMYLSLSSLAHLLECKAHLQMPRLLRNTLAQSMLPHLVRPLLDRSFWLNSRTTTHRFITISLSSLRFGILWNQSHPAMLEHRER